MCNVCFVVVINSKFEVSTKILKRLGVSNFNGYFIPQFITSNRDSHLVCSSVNI